MKKVIFLDIDGVLRPYNYTDAVEKVWKENPDCKTKDEFGYYFAPYAVDALYYILAATNANIVITSDWRRNGLSEMKRLWRQRRLPGIDKLIGITPMAGQPTRGDEIQAYLDDNLDITNYVIIDDLDIGTPHDLFFLKLDSKIGLTLPYAEAAVTILKNTQRVIKERHPDEYKK